MLDTPVDYLTLKKLYRRRRDHYKQLNFAEWLFAMQRVDYTLFQTEKSFYLTEVGKQYFWRGHYEKTQTT